MAGVVCLSPALVTDKSRSPFSHTQTSLANGSLAFPLLFLFFLSLLPLPFLQADQRTSQGHPMSMLA